MTSNNRFCDRCGAVAPRDTSRFCASCGSEFPHVEDHVQRAVVTHDSNIPVHSDPQLLAPKDANLNRSLETSSAKRTLGRVCVWAMICAVGFVIVLILVGIIALEVSNGEDLRTDSTKVSTRPTDPPTEIYSSDEVLSKALAEQDSSTTGMVCSEDHDHCYVSAIAEENYERGNYFLMVGLNGLWEQSYPYMREARDHYNKGINAIKDSDDPYLAKFYFKRGFTYEKEFLWWEARADYTRAIELAPCFGPSYYRRANILRELLVAASEDTHINTNRQLAGVVNDYLPDVILGRLKRETDREGIDRVEQQYQDIKKSNELWREWSLEGPNAHSVRRMNIDDCKTLNNEQFLWRQINYKHAKLSEPAIRTPGLFIKTGGAMRIAKYHKIYKTNWVLSHGIKYEEVSTLHFDVPSPVSTEDVRWFSSLKQFMDSMESPLAAYFKNNPHDDQGYGFGPGHNMDVHLIQSPRCGNVTVEWDRPSSDKAYNWFLKDRHGQMTSSGKLWLVGPRTHQGMGYKVSVEPLELPRGVEHRTEDYYQGFINHLGRCRFESSSVPTPEPTATLEPTSGDIYDVLNPDDYDATPGPAFSLSPESGPLGTVVTVSMSGFKRYTPIIKVFQGNKDVTPSPIPSTDKAGQVTFKHKIIARRNEEFIGSQTITVIIGEQVGKADFTVTTSTR